jgi:hypothetical protein
MVSVKNFKQVSFFVFFFLLCFRATFSYVCDNTLNCISECYASEDTFPGEEWIFADVFENCETFLRAVRATHAAGRSLKDNKMVMAKVNDLALKRTHERNMYVEKVKIQNSPPPPPPASPPARVESSWSIGRIISKLVEDNTPESLSDYVEEAQVLFSSVRQKMSGRPVPPKDRRGLVFVTGHFKRSAFKLCDTKMIERGSTCLSFNCLEGPPMMVDNKEYVELKGLVYCAPGLSKARGDKHAVPISDVPLTFRMVSHHDTDTSLVEKHIDILCYRAYARDGATIIGAALVCDHPDIGIGFVVTAYHVAKESTDFQTHDNVYKPKISWRLGETDLFIGVWPTGLHEGNVNSYVGYDILTKQFDVNYLYEELVEAAQECSWATAGFETYATGTVKASSFSTMSVTQNIATVSASAAAGDSGTFVTAHSGKRAPEDDYYCLIGVVSKSSLIGTVTLTLITGYSVNPFAGPEDILYD